MNLRDSGSVGFEHSYSQHIIYTICGFILYFSVNNSVSDWLLFSFEMCITPSPAHTQRIYSPELLRKWNSDQSSKIQRDVRKKLFRLRIWSPRHKYENKIKTENSKSNIPENVKVKTVNTTSVSDVRLGVMNVSSLGNKMDCVIDHITDNRLDIVGITETWLSNNDKNNMPVINTCLDSGYTNSGFSNNSTLCYVSHAAHEIQKWFKTR